jgi:hypothetical protein
MGAAYFLRKEYSMKSLAVLLLVCLTAAAAVAAEDNRTLKVFTLKDGSTVIALQTIAATFEGKTTYQITDLDGRKRSFDGSQVLEVAEQVVAANTLPNFGAPAAPVAAAAKDKLANDPPAQQPQAAPLNFPASAPRAPAVEPYRGPNLGLQPDDPTRSSLRNGFYPGYGFGSPYFGNFGVQNYALDRNGLRSLDFGGATLTNSNGPTIGLRPDFGTWNATLAQVGSSYYPNTPAGFAALLADGRNATLAQGGGTYIPNNPGALGGADVSAFPGYNNWPYTGNYFDSTYVKTTPANFNPYAPELAGSSFRPNNTVLSPIGSVTINNLPPTPKAAAQPAKQAQAQAPANRLVNQAAIAPRANNIASLPTAPRQSLQVTPVRSAPPAPSPIINHFNAAGNGAARAASPANVQNPNPNPNKR